MVQPRDIRPLEATRYVDPGPAGGQQAHPRIRAAAPRSEPGQDQVAVTDPHRAALRLLRQRVLESTRLLLGLHRGPSQSFAGGAPAQPEAFAGRLLSEQNLMASMRAGEWAPVRIAESLEEGREQGVAETLQILYELEELDAEVWRLVCGVQQAWHRKLVESTVNRR